MNNQTLLNLIEIKKVIFRQQMMYFLLSITNIALFSQKNILFQQFEQRPPHQDSSLEKRKQKNMISNTLLSIVQPIKRSNLKDQFVNTLNLQKYVENENYQNLKKQLLAVPLITTLIKSDVLQNPVAELTPKKQSLPVSAKGRICNQKGSISEQRPLPILLISAASPINIYLFYCMKTAILLLALTLIQLTYAGTLVITPRYPGAPVFDPNTCSHDVDYFIRNKYGYYLAYSELCYISYIDYKGGFLYIHQYKNYIGTFMAISRYTLPQREVNVVTFVRLGEGAPSMANIFDPITINPFAISLNLGLGEYQVPQFKKDEEPRWSEQWARQQFYKTPSAAEIGATRCVELDKVARRNYYYYLDGAILLSDSNSAFGSYCYCMNTYVNRIGIWQVIGSYTPFGVQINTFVRLGQGYDPSTVRKCVPYPSFNNWDF